MSYRRFSLVKIANAPATVAISATLGPGPSETVAEVASVARPKWICEPDQAESVAEFASVARAHAKSEHGAPERASTASEAFDRTFSANAPATVANFATVRGERIAPAAYCDSLERLTAACPAGVPEARWQLALADAKRFLSEWGEAAERLGWTATDLFDLHETVPLSRVDRMGLVWLLKGERVVLLAEAEARLERGQAIYRQPRATPSPEGVHPASGEPTQACARLAGHSPVAAPERQP